MGYVGISLSILISQKHKVIGVDINQEKIKLINKKVSPISDPEVEKYLKNENLNFSATTDLKEAINDTDFFIICTPTNYSSVSGTFDTSSVEDVVEVINTHNKKTPIVIKSTLPLGFTRKIRSKFNRENIFFSPEFLREDKALYDNFFPSRIIVGDNSNDAKDFANILSDCSKFKSNELPVLFMSSEEAESVKLFSNTYLAMRVSFFNELDSFSEIHNLSSKNIIEGVGHDSRIGNHYNNPSFGYGGYCLPKDTKQLLENFKMVPNNLIQAIVDSNKTRKKFIIQSILDKSCRSIGIYRLVMKKGGDNFRDSAIIDIIKAIRKEDIKIFIYEPLIKANEFEGIEVMNELDTFIANSDLIIANRMSNDLENVKSKTYTRDIFGNN